MTLATRIRLKRLGAKHDPHYRIVVADSRKQRDGRAIEELGYYSPAGSHPDFQVNAERARHWLDLGAQPSDTVRSLLRKAGVIEGEAEEAVAAPAETAAAAEAEVAADQAEAEVAEDAAEDQ